jgi:hypothetical protein
MWQDYMGIVPGVAAAVMGIITMATQKMPRWQKLGILGLTVVAIGATGFSQWWTLHEKRAQEAQRTATLEMFGSLIGDGEKLMNAITSNPDKPVPLFEINDWTQKSENYLGTLGNSYVARFRSPAGLGSYSWNKMNDERNGWLNHIQRRVVRLHEFSRQTAETSEKPF